MSQIISVRKITEPEELDIVFAIRRKVFVEEQQCPPELEWEHEDESVHFMAMLGDKPAGAARWRKTEKGYKLERFAVLPQYRGMHVGEALVKAVLADLPEAGTHTYLHAQVQAVPFYEKLGFVKEGAEFTEAGITHYRMHSSVD